MSSSRLLNIIPNFFASLALISLLLAPVFFASNLAKVAGVKTESRYLLVSQIEKFPNMTFSQSQDLYQVTFTKFGPSQAFLGFALINNPTDRSQTYEIKTVTPVSPTGGSGSARLFFGDDLQNQQAKITLPSQVSVPISLFSNQESTSESQTAEFKIEAK